MIRPVLLENLKALASFFLKILTNPMKNDQRKFPICAKTQMGSNQVKLDLGFKVL